jgi:hypothetical protein
LDHNNENVSIFQYIQVINEGKNHPNRIPVPIAPLFALRSVPPNPPPHPWASPLGHPTWAGETWRIKLVGGGEGGVPRLSHLLVSYREMKQKTLYPTHVVYHPQSFFGPHLQLPDFLAESLHLRRPTPIRCQCQSSHKAPSRTANSA